MAKPLHGPPAQIVDIRNETPFIPLGEQIRSGLNKPDGEEKCLPTLLLYDEQGLQLFEKITYLDEYYLTNEEIRLLEDNAESIAQRIARRPDSVVLELGSGNLRKVKILLDALERKKVPVSYYALDLSIDELKRTLAQIPEGTYQYVRCQGLWGTYDDGLAWLKAPGNAARAKAVLSLGSSIGNFNREESIAFLGRFAGALSNEDAFLLAIDRCIDAQKVYHAYNDKEGLTHQFVLNGLLHANKQLGNDAFHLSDWEVIGEYDAAADCHHAFVVPKRSVTVEAIHLQAGERVRMEESYKYGSEHADQLFRGAGVVEAASWLNDDGDYGLYLLQRPRINEPTNPELYAASAVPSPNDWEHLWIAWDTVTRDMIPDEELLEKPIKLRNACIFYLGHIPTFLDIHLTRAATGKATEPAYFSRIFERGIDPDVDDPEQCHAHSEIPDAWPPLNKVLEFQKRVRQRVKALYNNEAAIKKTEVAKALWLGFEHEVMHLETLLYMLVQSERTLPPPGTIAPDFESLAKQAQKNEVPNQWFDVPEQIITIGVDDDDSSIPLHSFGWDNEKPARQVTVKALSIQGRPISNGEYASYLQRSGQRGYPASWEVEQVVPGSSASQDGYMTGKFVRTVYGKVPLALALHWPVSASYDELSGYATYWGGRIPSMEEARSVYNHVEKQRRKQRDAVNARHERIPAVNGHLSNNGVQETPPSPHDSAHSLDEAAKADTDVFIDLAGTNTGFRHWHPMPVTDKGNRLAGQSDMGGLWEWTSTTLEPHDGFQAMDLYPGYTADFFDGKHNIVLGGSWATLARVAGRKSFVNWYQRNYPYVWAGARLVRDPK